MHIHRGHGVDLPLAACLAAQLKGACTLTAGCENVHAPIKRPMDVELRVKIDINKLRISTITTFDKSKANIPPQTVSAMDRG